MKIPEPLHTTAAAINLAHEKRAAQEVPRPHMGISQLGKEDDRELWLSFRWAFKQHFDGRLLRLFRRGHLEEATVVDDLIAAGMDVRDTGGQQRNLDFGSHVKGSCDGIITRGVFEAPNTPHLLEIKTISKKRFEALQKQGLEKSNFLYWVQVHCYMHGTGLDRCLFLAVCKDNDEIYTERVKYNKAIAEKYITRGQRIALADRMPEPVYYDATDWRVKFSPYYAAYFPESAATEHYARLTPQRESTHPLLARICVNYRTDATSTPREDGTWYNERWQAEIPEKSQHLSDDGHVLHPDIMAFAGWQMLDGVDEFTARYRLPSGKTVLNGAPRMVDGEIVFTSNELLAAPELCASLKTDEQIMAIRETLEGRIHKYLGVE